MERIALAAQGRTQQGKNPNRRLRVAGKIPAVMYGLGMDNQMLALDRHDFVLALQHAGDEMVMYEISAADAGVDKQLTVVRDLQRDPVTDQIVHVDLLRIDMNTPIDVEVPIHGTGDPIGLKEGGLLDQNLWTLHIRCLPTDVPSHIDVDISGMAVNDTIHVSDLPLGERVELLTSEDESVFSVVVPQMMSEPEEAEAAEGEELAAGEEAPEGEEAGGEKREKEE